MNNRHDTYAMYERMRATRRKRRLIWLSVFAVLCLILFGISHILDLSRGDREKETEAIIHVYPSSETTSSGPRETTTPRGNDLPPETPQIYVDYDYALPMPESGAVSEEYFSDAIFIGDSRTDGLLLYTGLSVKKSYAFTSLMVDTVFTRELVFHDGGYIPVSEAVKVFDDWHKVYIMLGTNELGWRSSEYFIRKYGEVVSLLRQIHPDCEIYMQSILPIRSENGENVAKVSEFNALLRSLAEEKKVFFVDVYSFFADESGQLPEEAGKDGIHLNSAYCRRWLEFLQTHTYEGLVASGWGDTK